MLIRKSLAYSLIGLILLGNSAVQAGGGSAPLLGSDQSSSNQRDPLPSCVHTKFGAGDDTDVTVTNNCSYPVTLKFDYLGPNVTQDISPGNNFSDGAIGLNGIYCCPNYSRCS